MAHSLAVAQVEQINRGLLALGTLTHEWADDLGQGDFCAFVPYQKFMESFATNATERDIHREYLKERARAMISIAPGRYTSALVEQLRAAADKSHLRQDPATEWIPRLHIDPCEQNAFLMKVRDPLHYEKREQAMLEQRANRLEIEKLRHSTAIASKLPGGMIVKPMRFAFAARILEKELAHAGFRRVRANPESGGVIASKSISTEWDLDWSIADPDLFYFGPGAGSLTMSLKLRGSNASKTGRDDAPGTAFSIAYPALVYGFSTAYMAFQDLASLETIVKAHVQLYRTIAPGLEKAVADAL